MSRSRGYASPPYRSRALAENHWPLIIVAVIALLGKAIFWGLVFTAIFMVIM